MKTHLLRFAHTDIIVFLSVLQNAHVAVLTGIGVDILRWNGVHHDEDRERGKKAVNDKRWRTTR